jgi:hypothetical protein
MSKYKVGDRVRVTAETYTFLPAGGVGVVTEVRPNGAILVDSEEWPSRTSGGTGWPFSRGQLQLIDEPPPAADQKGNNDD